MTHDSYREPGEFGEGATVRRADPIREQVDQNLRHLQAAVDRRELKAWDGKPTLSPLVLKAEADAEIERLTNALRKIAAYDDAAANAYLRATGSYRAFDEPGAVEMARGVLEGKTDG